MALIGQPDIQPILEVVGVDVTCAGDTTKGRIKRGSVPLAFLGDQASTVYATEETVVVESGILAGLVVGVDLTVDGVAYRAADIRQLGHGRLTHVLLERSPDAGGAGMLIFGDVVEPIGG